MAVKRTSSAERLHGREKLLAQLQGAAMTGKTVLVFGPIGIGKTAILRELQRRVAAAGRPCGYASRVTALGDVTRALGDAYPEVSAHERTQRSYRASLRMAVEVRPGVLLLDHLARAGTGLRGFLRSLQGTGLGVLLAGDVEYPRDRARLRELRLAYREEEVPPLTPRQLRRVLEDGLRARTLPWPLGERDRAVLLDAAQGRPGRVVAFAERLADAQYWEDGHLRVARLTGDVWNVETARYLA